jgi:hypothetical protein
LSGVSTYFDAADWPVDVLNFKKIKNPFLFGEEKRIGLNRCYTPINPQETIYFLRYQDLTGFENL